MVIPCSVNNNKLTCKLTYTVGCKCKLSMSPPQLHEFHTGLELIYLDSSCSWLGTQVVLNLTTLERRNMPWTKLLSIYFAEPSLFYVLLRVLNWFQT